MSLTSARAEYSRLTTVASPLSPETFLALDDAELRAVGFSRQKARYGRLLVGGVLEVQLNLATLEARPDDDVREALMAQITFHAHASRITSPISQERYL